MRFRDDDWYADNAVDLVVADTGAQLDVAGRAVVLASSRRVPLWRLLIATGSAPRRPPGTAGFETRTNCAASATRDACARIRRDTGFGQRASAPAPCGKDRTPIRAWTR